MSTDKTQINLLGKDYFTVEEAAHYAGVSRSQFLEQAPLHGIFPLPGFGRQVYRRSDIQRAIEKQWRPSRDAKTAKAGTAITS